MDDLWNSRAERAAKLPREQKQRALDLLHQSWTIGEVAKEMGWDTWLVSAIIDENMEKKEILSLRTEAR